MASFGIPGDGSDRADTAPPPDDAGTGTAEPVDGPVRDDRSSRRFSGSRVMGTAEREHALTEARATDFPISLRGYDRTAVDRYVERVTRLITELEMSASPEAAVRHALDEVSEETRDILQRAYQTADDIAARSRAKADDRLAEAEREAQEMLEASRREAEEILAASRHEAQDLREMTTGEVQNLRETSQRETGELRERTMRELAELREEAAREAHQLRTTAQRESDEMRGAARHEAETMTETAEGRTRDLARDAETIWRERQRLIDDMRAVGEQLVAIGEVEGKRFVRPIESPFVGAARSDGNGSPPNTEPADAPGP
jgi:cell division septum initiation protein DivIVA